MSTDSGFVHLSVELQAIPDTMLPCELQIERCYMADRTMYSIEPWKLEDINPTRKQCLIDTYIRHLIWSQQHFWDKELGAATDQAQATLKQQIDEYGEARVLRWLDNCLNVDQDSINAPSILQHASFTFIIDELSIQAAQLWTNHFTHAHHTVRSWHRIESDTLPLQHPEGIYENEAARKIYEQVVNQISGAANAIYDITKDGDMKAYLFPLATKTRVMTTATWEEWRGFEWLFEYVFLQEIKDVIWNIRSLLVDAVPYIFGPKD